MDQGILLYYFIHIVFYKLFLRYILCMIHCIVSSVCYQYSFFILLPPIPVLSQLSQDGNIVSLQLLTFFFTFFFFFKAYSLAVINSSVCCNEKESISLFVFKETL